MKYSVGEKFLLETSLGDKETSIVNIKYEFADYIKGGPKYVSEKELESYMNAGTLRPLNKSQKEEDIKQLEIKYGIKLMEVE